MDSHKRVEIHFWENLVRSLGRDGFIAQRKADFEHNNGFYEGKSSYAGKGLEVGSGLFSQLEWVKGKVISVDPIMDEYIRLSDKYGIPNEKVTLVKTEDENLPFKNEDFHWVVCWNVIDHTPNPKLLADEMWRVLKKGGKLYFEVHEDDHLSAAHYGLWNDSVIDNTFDDKWKLEYHKRWRNPDYPQWKNYRIYRKV